MIKPIPLVKPTFSEHRWSPQNFTQVEENHNIFQVEEYSEVKTLDWKPKSLDLPVAPFNYKFSYIIIIIIIIIWFSHVAHEVIFLNHIDIIWVDVFLFWTFFVIWVFGYVGLLVLGWINKNESWYLEDYLFGWFTFRRGLCLAVLHRFRCALLLLVAWWSE